VIYQGEHPAIIEPELWELVNSDFRRVPRTRLEPRNEPQAAPLAGLLICAGCHQPMIATYSKKGTQRYRYYVCQTAREKGWTSCATKSVSAKRCGAMEEKVGSLEGLLSSVLHLLADHFVDFHADKSMRKAMALFVSILHLRHPKSLSAGEGIRAQMVAAFESLPEDGAGQPRIESIERNGVLRPFASSGWHEYRAATEREEEDVRGRYSAERDVLCGDLHEEAVVCRVLEATSIHHHGSAGHRNK
jgi:hypothetical protein